MKKDMKLGNNCSAATITVRGKLTSRCACACYGCPCGNQNRSSDCKRKSPCPCLLVCSSKHLSLCQYILNQRWPHSRGC